MRSGSSRQGSSLIEFAFMLVPLMILIVGSIEVDRLLLTYTSLSNAANATVRYAAVHGNYNPDSVSNIQQVGKNFAALGALDPASANVNVVYQDGNSNIGSRVSVTVSTPFSPLTAFFPVHVTMSSTAKATITF